MDASASEPTRSNETPVFWRNQIFLKDGSSVWGLKTWNTENDAKTSADRQIRRLRDWVSQGIVFEIETDNGDINPENVSHVVQVAVQGEQ
jgi:hypothetical protein